MGYHDFLSNKCCLTVTRNLVGEPFCVSLLSEIGEFCAVEWYNTNLSRLFWLTVPRTFVGEPFSVWLISDIMKKFVHKGGKSQKFVEVFSSHTREKSCEPIGFPGHFGHRKNYAWEVGYHDFPSRIFCLTVRKFFEGIPCVFHYFRVSESSVHERGVPQFSVEFFSLTLLRIFVGKPFSVSLISDISINFTHKRAIS